MDAGAAVAPTVPQHPGPRAGRRRPTARAGRAAGGLRGLPGVAGQPPKRLARVVRARGHRSAIATPPGTWPALTTQTAPVRTSQVTSPSRSVLSSTVCSSTQSSGSQQAF